MHKLIALSSILVSVVIGSCKDDSAKKTSNTTERTKSAPQSVAKMSDAVAKLAPASESTVEGQVEFSAANGDITIHAKLTGLTPGPHGFHVHEKGDCSSPDAKSAGGHFNPRGVAHGGPKGEIHHSGDFGNIIAGDDGSAELKLTLPKTFLSLEPSADNSILGKAVIVHGGKDDLTSQPSGNAGPRVACGVITAR